ncbi:hypothetical protein AgCh_013545 [Apium graveolens]
MQIVVPMECHALQIRGEKKLASSNFGVSEECHSNVKSVQECQGSLEPSKWSRDGIFSVMSIHAFSSTREKGLSATWTTLCAVSIREAANKSTQWMARIRIPLRYHYHKFNLLAPDFFSQFAGVFDAIGEFCAVVLDWLRGVEYRVPEVRAPHQSRSLNGFGKGFVYGSGSGSGSGYGSGYGYGIGGGGAHCGENGSGSGSGGAHGTGGYVCGSSVRHT